MNKKISVAAVVVTFNRKEMLEKNIRLLLNQTRKLDRIYIIDNASTDGTEQYLQSIIENRNIKYIRLLENTGGSGGFYTGIKKAYEDGFDYIWGMDDDAFPDKFALEKLLVAKELLGDDSCLWSNCNNDSNFTNDFKEVRDWMFVGFFLSSTVIKTVGFPREDFFIYWDDCEYSHRIIKKGYKIFKVKNSIIDHMDYFNRETIQMNLFGKTVIIPIMPSWKWYYYIRNRILMYKLNDFNKYKQIIIFGPISLIKAFIADRKNFKICFKGYFDGIFGISGKRIRP